ncbi:putative acetyltransferase [Lophiotrema nucula]|uniref:Putative acetyltransferase n=1 Tax=Lophiotrema nucula TaxID=690887 RepID=A0A6A5ZT19_9PLEO|nr:putative acetyltransferase [Lophiotrema nucula]
MSNKLVVEILEAEFPKHRSTVEALYTAYANSLEIDLTFQKFEEELASLPGKYHPDNGGALFIARVIGPFVTADDGVIQPGKIIGCVAIRAFAPPNICELKRLYVMPEARGVGAGEELLKKAIDTAKELEYKEMLLDTLPSMVKARKKYIAAGFEEVEPYYESPIKGTSFMKLDLTQ